MPEIRTVEDARANALNLELEANDLEQVACPLRDAFNEIDERCYQDPKHMLHGTRQGCPSQPARPSKFNDPVVFVFPFWVFAFPITACCLCLLLFSFWFLVVLVFYVTFFFCRMSAG